MEGRICHSVRANVICSGILLSFWPILSLGQTGADDWRQEPQTLMPAKADDVTRKVRTARNRFFDRVYGPPPKGWFSNGPDLGPIFEEIPAYGDLTVALVQFADYRTLLSASKKTIYIEVRMNIEQVLRDPSGTARPKRKVTIGIPGGSVILPSGQIIQQGLRQAEVCGIRPRHRYLAFLAYEHALELFECAKTWDLSTGVAVATYTFDVSKAKEGTSRFAGLPEDQFVAAVKAMLPPRK
jgi:hypothetical protein